MTAFATVEAVGIRLGYVLSEAQEDQAAAVLEQVAGLIRDVAGLDEDPDPVPSYFTALSVEKAVGVLTNPSNLASESEQLGALQRSQTYPRFLDTGIFLTRAERREIRRLVGSDSFQATTLVSPYSGDEELSELDFDFPLVTEEP